MACIIYVTTTKSANKTWNHHSLSAQYEQYNIWLEKFPGFVSKSGREVDQNTWENTFIFESREAWDNFIKAKANLDWWKDIVKYNADNGIVSRVDFQE